MRPDRRAAPRLRLAFPVLLDGPQGLRRCVARDISPRGLFVETSELHPEGTSVRVTFALPDGSWEMTTRCEVRHVVRERGPKGLLEGLGLVFTGVEFEADDLITVARRAHA